MNYNKIFTTVYDMLLNVIDDSDTVKYNTMKYDTMEVIQYNIDDINRKQVRCDDMVYICLDTILSMLNYC